MVACATLYACSSKMNAVNSAQGINQLSTDRNGNPMLIGQCTKKGLQQQPFSTWFDKNYNDYKIDQGTADQLKPKLEGKTFTLFLGTWCGDSQREVPRMIRLLEYCGIKPNRLKLVMVSNHDSMIKQSPAHEERGLNIHRVPTLLVYNGTAELGRIVEEPVKSLEKDLLAIVSGEPYATNYKSVDYLTALMKTKTLAELAPDIDNIAGNVKSKAKNYYELNTYAHVTLRGGDADKALFIATVNEKSFPAEADVYFRKGYILHSMGRNDEAITCYEKTLQLKPDHENAQKMLKVLKP